MRRRTFLAGALALCALAGCSPSPVNEAPASPAAKGFPFTLTDTGGRRVEIPAPPQRIVCLSPAHTETLFALGVGDRVVAADTYSDYPPEVRSRATINCWPRIPLEEVVALRPDLVLVLTQEGEELKRLEAAGVRAAQLFPKTLAETLDCIRLLGRITGTTPTAEELVTEMRQRVDEVQRRVRGRPRPRVIMELDATDPARPWVAGGGAIYHEVLRLAGGDNLFADQPQPTLQVTAEQIIAADPEVILLGDMISPLQPQRPELVGRRAGWSQITAVKDGRIFGLKSERITRPAPRFVEGLEEVARRLHPDAFTDGQEP